MAIKENGTDEDKAYLPEKTCYNSTHITKQKHIKAHPKKEKMQFYHCIYHVSTSNLHAGHPTALSVAISIDDSNYKVLEDKRHEKDSSNDDIVCKASYDTLGESGDNGINAAALFFAANGGNAEEAMTDDNGALLISLQTPLSCLSPTYRRKYPFYQRRKK